MEIKSINWIVTDTCNGRCVNCDMWETEGRRTDLGLEDIRRILSDESVKKGYEKYGRAFDISFAGGEPFIRKDLQTIVDLVESMYPGSFKSVSTNALLSDRILLFVEKNRHLRFKLNISIDGMEEVNDLMRGRGAFLKAVGLVRAVKKRFPEQIIEIKLTLSPQNYDQILKVYWLSVKLGCQFSFKPLENLENFTNSRKSINTLFTPEQICVIRNQCFKMSDFMYGKNDFKKAKFYRDIPFYLARKKMPTSCSVLNEHLTIMPAGECYFCVKEPSIGSMPQNPLSAIKPSYDLDNFKCKSCMLICGVYKDYTKDAFKKTVANIEIINRCNLACSFCTQKGFEAFKADVMSLERFEQLINEHPQISHMSFIGGESFMNKNFFAMMDVLDRRGITYEITSNGTLITPQVVERLKSCIGLKNILFSLDGLEECHDRERGLGTYNKCLQAIRSMKDLFTIGVCSVFKADNQDEILQLSDVLADMGIRDHRIIYGMSHSRQAVESSASLASHFVFQGPQFDGQVDDYIGTMNFFQSLEQTALRNQINVTYVPDVFRSQTKAFMEGNLAAKKQVQCMQLDQFRFDASGERIICEFIRNPFEEKTVGELKQQLLPLCEKCCKLRAVEAGT